LLSKLDSASLPLL